MLRNPCYFIFYGLVLLPSFLSSSHLWTVVGIVTAALLCLLYYSYFVTKWRIWAFTTVADIHELKTAATAENYIPRDGSWLERLEIRSRAEKIKLREINALLQEPYAFPDDATVPEELVLFFSNAPKRKMLFLFLFCVVFPFLLAFITGAWLLLIIALFFFLWGAKADYRKLFDKRAQVIISHSGVETVNAGFHSWLEITNEEVIEDNDDRSDYVINVFKFQYPGGSERIVLDNLTTSVRQFRHALHVYRQRADSKPYSDTHV